MTSAAFSHAQSQQLHIYRLSRLRNELRFALSRIDAAVLREWGGRSAGRLVRLTGQRVGALSALVKSIGRAGVAEATGFGQADSPNAYLGSISCRPFVMHGRQIVGRDGHWSAIPFRSAMRRLSTALGDRIIFALNELTGQDWVKERKFIERYGSFNIPDDLWAKIKMISTVRNALIHDNGALPYKSNHALNFHARAI